MAEQLAILLDGALAAWEDRRAPECEAKVWHGPGHQSRTHCEVPADEPHEVHAANYGWNNQFGVWKDDPTQVDPKYPHIIASDAFDADDDDDDLVREYDAEARGREERARLSRAEFLAAYLSERSVTLTPRGPEDGLREAAQAVAKRRALIRLQHQAMIRESVLDDVLDALEVALEPALHSTPAAPKEDDRG